MFIPILVVIVVLLCIFAMVKDNYIPCPPNTYRARCMTPDGGPVCVPFAQQ